MSVMDDNGAGLAGDRDGASAAGAERVALLFAGQGAQAVGMGKDLYDAYPEVRALYARASALSGLDLARLSFEGPESELVRTDVSQPAIVCASLAALRVLRLRCPDLRPACAAGLSLGEYAALAAAGALDEAEALRLVTLRGRFMQQACQATDGGMASVIGLEPEAVRSALAPLSTEAEPVVVANLNSPKQVVIAGARAALARAGEALKAAGARRVIPLSVAGAYHSPLMAAARERLEPYLGSAVVAAPRFAVYANVTAAPHEGPAEIRDRLAEQVTSPVRFSETIQAMRAAGVTRFVELGPGGVVKGLLRQVSRDIECISLMSLESFSALDALAAPPTEAASTA